MYKNVTPSKGKKLQKRGFGPFKINLYLTLFCCLASNLSHGIKVKSKEKNGQHVTQQQIS